jgi:hypothetical protein
MKIETSKFIFYIKESYSTFDRDAYLAAYNQLLMLKKTPLVEGRLPKKTRIEIGLQRRYLKSNWTRIYKVDVYFKKYRHTARFDVEYHVPTEMINTKHKKKRNKLENIHRGGLAQIIKEQGNAALGRYRKEVLQKTDDLKMILKEYPVKVFGSRYSTKGTIYSEPGQIRAISLKRKVKDLYIAKLPVKPNRYIGLELEFCAPIEELDFAIKLWEAGVHKFAQIKKDGSLRPKVGEYGYELAFLFPETHYKKNLRQVCKILKEVGARADDRRCGLHVHIDMRHRKKDIVYNNLVACQNVLFSFLDPDRRGNEFCRTVESRKFPKKFDNTREERYKTINAASYYKYKTLEVRMHEGSVNYTQIVNWMALLIKISNHKTRIKTDINELTILKKRFRIDNKVSEFFQDKTCHWQLQGPQRRSGERPTSSRMTTEVIDRIRVASEEVLGVNSDDLIPF